MTDVTYSKIEKVISKLNAMSNIPSACNYNTGFITGELLTYYNSLNDQVKENIQNLENMILGVSVAAEYSLEYLKENEEEDYEDLKNRIDSFFEISNLLVNGVTDDENMSDIISYDEYMTLFNGTDELFEPLYREIYEEMKNRLFMQRQTFLRDTVPQTYDSLVESSYLRCSDTEIGSPEYDQGLEEYKRNFTHRALASFSPDEIDEALNNVPSYLLDGASDYEKTLYILSYNKNLDNGFHHEFRGYLKDSLIDSGLDETLLEDDYSAIDTTFNILIKTNNFLTRDFDQEFSGLSEGEKTNKVIKAFKDYLVDVNMTDQGDVIFNLEVADGKKYSSDEGRIWRETLDEFGYTDHLEREFTDEELYSGTFNSDFLANVARKEGQAQVYNILKQYYLKGGKTPEETADKLETLFRGYNPYIYTSVISYANNQNIIDSMGLTYNDMAQTKVMVDAAKSNYKLGLLESLDVSDVDEADMNAARRYLNTTGDLEYLEDWQIKAFAKLWKNDVSTATGLLDNTLHNSIQEKKGYQQAEDTYNIMTGETQKQLLNQLIHNEMISDIFGTGTGIGYTAIKGFTDGVDNSIINLGDMALADGKLNAHDYYLGHLQELLSQGGFKNDALKLEYNIASGVGNMAIPLALSAFVGPEAMSAWIVATTTGSERENALRNGEDNNFGTFAQAFAKGVVEASMERSLGAITGYGAKDGELLSLFESNSNFMTSFMSTKWGKTLAATLSSCVNESVEELAENAGNHIIDLIRGKGFDMQDLPKETWETVYMTMLTTPFINLMGGGFQNAKLRSVNQMNTYNLNGFDVICSDSEIIRFTNSDGKVDTEALFDYLVEQDGRIIVNNAEVLTNDDGSFIERIKGKLDDILHRNNNADTIATVEEIVEIDVEDSAEFYKKYGSVDQDAVAHVTKQKRDQLVQFAMDKYNLSKRDAEIIIRCINSKGACLTADQCNVIYGLYEYDNAQFTNDFGYPIVNSDGKLNDAQLLLDLYIYANSQRGDQGLIIKNPDGTSHINSKFFNFTKTTIKAQTYSYNLSKFLNTQNNCSIDLNNLHTYRPDYELYGMFTDTNGETSAQTFKNIINDEISHGFISLSLMPEVNMYECKGNMHRNTPRTITGGHAVTVSSCDDNGVYVRSWNKEFYIPYTELAGKNSQGQNKCDMRITVIDDTMVGVRR